MSSHLNWLIVRNNHAYLHKKQNIKKPFSSEPGNLKNVNSLRFNGLVNQKTVHVAPEKQGKGVVLTFKSLKYQSKPSKNALKSSFKAGQRKNLTKLRKFFKVHNYRKELTMTALRRASAIQRSQKPLPLKRRKRVRTAGKVGKNAKAGKGTAKKAE